MVGDESPVRTLARYWCVEFNLYTLSDGRFWFDDVGRDVQGFITPKQAALIRTHTSRAEGYRTETLAALLEEYSGNNGQSVVTLSMPYPNIRDAPWGHEEQEGLGQAAVDLLKGPGHGR